MQSGFSPHFQGQNTLFQNFQKSIIVVSEASNTNIYLICATSLRATSLRSKLPDSKLNNTQVKWDFSSDIQTLC